MVSTCPRSGHRPNSAGSACQRLLRIRAADREICRRGVCGVRNLAHLIVHPERNHSRFTTTDPARQR